MLMNFADISDFRQASRRNDDEGASRMTKLGGYKKYGTHYSHFFFELCGSNKSFIHFVLDIAFKTFILLFYSLVYFGRFPLSWHNVVVSDLQHGDWI